MKVRKGLMGKLLKMPRTLLCGVRIQKMLK